MNLLRVLAALLTPCLLHAATPTRPNVLFSIADDRLIHKGTS